MRKITKQMLEAFNANISKKLGNTEVIAGELTTGVLLHGNLIAIKYQDNSIAVTNAGWFTPTTKERLNALPGVSVCQKKSVWYLNSKEWDGHLTLV